jgi:hypothetical protein
MLPGTVNGSALNRDVLLLSSCTLVLGSSPRIQHFKRKGINLDVKTEAISIGNFPLDYPFAEKYFLIVVYLGSQLNPTF